MLNSIINSNMNDTFSPFLNTTTQSTSSLQALANSSNQNQSSLIRTSLVITQSDLNKIVS